jgi:diguanylate cyclase (GGDEF)-like protein
VGGVIGQTLRRGDFAGRFGGEEFLLLFPESSLDGALCAAERLRAAIATIEITELPAAERIEVSIGLAAHQPYETLEHTLGRADRALYTAKQWGRARTVIDESRHLLTGTDGELVTSGGGGRLFS